MKKITKKGQKHEQEKLSLKPFLALLLFALWPYLNVWAINYIHHEYIDYTRLVAFFAVIFAIALGFFAIVFYVTLRKSSVRSLYAASGFIVVFLNYHILSPVLSNSLILYFIIMLGMVCIFYYFSKFSLFKNLALIVPLVGVVVIITDVITHSEISINIDLIKQFGYSPRVDAYTQDSTVKWEQTFFSKPSVSPKHTPNIYFIILDSTLRNDAFKRFYDPDDTDYDDFLNFVKKEGFYHVKDSYSNYPVTGVSIPSTLNMDYMITNDKDGPKEIRNRTKKYRATTILSAMKGYNATSSALRARGYDIYHTSNGFLPASDCGGYEDQCIRKNSHFNLFTQQELGLIKITPLKRLMDNIQVNWKHTTPDDMIPDFRDDTIVFFHSFQPRDIPNYIPKNTKKPFFWFIHLMGLHNLAFNSDCQYQHPVEIAQRHPICHKKPARGCIIKVAYREQATCMFKQLKYAITEITKRDPAAIIVLQGDHGSSIINNFRERPTEQWTEADIHEIFSILNVIKGPKDLTLRLYPTVSPVNTFRIILGYIDGQDYPLLPDVSYIAAYRDWWPGYSNGNGSYLPLSLRHHPLTENSSRTN